MTAQVHFKSLNGVRFIAALLVFVHHLEALKKSNDSANMFHFPWVQKAGELGVTIFFCISGFLITFLLLEERRVSGDIDIKKFYVRRILRIWPLYFLIIILSLTAAKLDGSLDPRFFTTKLTLYMFFLANIAFRLYEHGGFPSQLWSVASEEQFYLFWPWLIRVFRKNIQAIFLFIVLVFLTVRIMFDQISAVEISFRGLDYFKLLKDYFIFFRIDCMAIGGFFAYLYFSRSPYLKKLFSKSWQILIYFLTALIVFASPKLIFFEFPIQALLFSALILNLATNPGSIVSLENRYMNYLGKISYGFYVYHPLLLSTVGVSIIHILAKYSAMGQGIFYIGMFIVTVAVSHVSYHLFELPFLKMKEKYAVVKSMPSPQEKMELPQ